MTPAMTLQTISVNSFELLFSHYSSDHLYACMQNCMPACRVACLHAELHACMQNCMPACRIACKVACLHAGLHAGLHACMQGCMSACNPACLHAGLHACMQPCMQACRVACLRGYTARGPPVICHGYKFHVRLFLYSNLWPWNQGWRLRSALRQRSIPYKI